MHHESKNLRRIDSFLVWILVTSCENQQILALEHDDVIIHPLHLTFCFSFVARNSSNVLSGSMLTLRRYAFIRPYQGSEIPDF